MDSACSGICGGVGADCFVANGDTDCFPPGIKCVANGKHNYYKRDLGKCTSPNLPIGASCTGNSICAGKSGFFRLIDVWQLRARIRTGNNCASGVCGGSGAACSSASDCASGTFLPIVLTGVQADSNLRFITDLNCDNGICSLKKVGASCSKDGECISRPLQLNTA